MKPFLPFLTCSVLATAALADNLVIPLWPEGVPAAVRADAPAAKGPIGEEKISETHNANISVPTLTVFAPAVDHRGIDRKRGDRDVGVVGRGDLFLAGRALGGGGVGTDGGGHALGPERDHEVFREGVGGNKRGHNQEEFHGGKGTAGRDRAGDGPGERGGAGVGWG